MEEILCTISYDLSVFTYLKTVKTYFTNCSCKIALRFLDQFKFTLKHQKSRQSFFIFSQKNNKQDMKRKPFRKEYLWQSSNQILGLFPLKRNVVVNVSLKKASTNSHTLTIISSPITSNLVIITWKYIALVFYTWSVLRSNNSKQNIWKKVKKPSKFGQNLKLWFIILIYGLDTG